MRSNATDIELRVSWKTTLKGKQLCLMEFKKKGCSESGLGFSTAICSEMRSAKNQNIQTWTRTSLFVFDRVNLFISTSKYERKPNLKLINNRKLIVSTPKLRIHFRWAKTFYKAITTTSFPSRYLPFRSYNKR